MFTPWSDPAGTAPVTRRARTAAIYTGLAFVAVLAIWFGAYASGVFPWLGYVSLNSRSLAAEPVGIVGRDTTGASTQIGLKTFAFLKGQTIVIRYDAEIRRGCLWLQVWHMFREGKDSSVSTCITASGTGEWTVPVTETGVYAVIIDSSVIRGVRPGWDMSYAAWWGARW